MSAPRPALPAAPRGGMSKVAEPHLLMSAALTRPWSVAAWMPRPLSIMLVLALGLGGAARAQTAAEAIPSLAALEAEGATIGTIRIVNRDIFDTSDPREDKLLFRWANALHIRTRVSVIEGALLFKSGDPLSVRLIDETERLLRSTRYLYDVRLRPVAYRDGVADIEVETRDSWTLDPSFSVGRAGGVNSGRVSLTEHNLLGSGISLSFGRSTNVDRSSNEFRISNERAFGGWTALGYSRAHNSDGRREAASITQPFHALDARWSAGISLVKDDRIDSRYVAGVVASQYRHRQKQGELFGGLSHGRVNGWVQRASLGISVQDDAYAIEPGLIAPAQLPSDEKWVAPFLRYQVIEDRFEKLQNRNQIERPEFFALGLAMTLQLGRAFSALGSTSNAWLYSATLSRGFEPGPGQMLLASASLTGQAVHGRVRRQRLGLQTQYYLPHKPGWLFYAAATFDALNNPGPADELLLGGDNGLRGYPLRYQSGSRRALFTLEERAYSDLYLWRLLRVGGAVFVDSGRAWGGGHANTVNPGWLSDAGFGLRLFSVRSAFNNVLHIDVAFPLVGAAGTKKVQFLVKTKASF